MGRSFFLPRYPVCRQVCVVYIYLKKLIIAKQFIIYVMLSVMFIVQDIHATSIRKLYVMNYSSVHIFVTSVATQPIAQGQICHVVSTLVFFELLLDARNTNQCSNLFFFKIQSLSVLCS